MDNPGAYFAEHYAHEQRRRRRQRWTILWFSIASVALAGGAWYAGFGPPQLLPLWGVVVLTGIGVMLIGFSKGNREREDTLLSLVEVDPSLLENRNRMTLVMDALQADQFESIQVSKKHQRMRGSDAKGFTSGVVDSTFDPAQDRRDSSLSDGVYAELEGELRPSEVLVNEANLRYGELAQKRWESAESSDVDLIEAGVERLGDLVRTDWFEKNAKEGAVKEVMDRNSDNETS